MFVCATLREEAILAIPFEVSFIAVSTTCVEIIIQLRLLPLQVMVENFHLRYKEDSV